MLAHLLPYLPLILGPLVTGMTQFVKNTASIPINAGNILALRATVMLLSVLVAIVVAYITGTLATLDGANLVEATLNAITTYTMAVTAYEHVAKTLSKP